MTLIYSENAAGLLERQERLAPNSALRFALLGPPGSGKVEFSKSIEEQVRSRRAGHGPQAHVRIDSAQCNGFEFDDAHARIMTAIRSQVAVKAEFSGLPENKDATITFVPAIRNLFESWNGHLFLYLDRLELLSGNLIRSLGNTFRELLESEEAHDAPDRFHLVWSGSISLFELRSIENSPLAMCEPVAFPIQDQLAHERTVARFCENDGIGTLDREANEALIGATRGEPGFVGAMLRQLKQSLPNRSPKKADIERARDEIVKRGWTIPELRRVGSLILASDKIRELGERLIAGEPAYSTEFLADIDRFQLFGIAIVQPEQNRRRYFWRNQIVEAFCRQLLGVGVRQRGKKRSATAIVKASGADIPATIERALQGLQELRGPFAACEIAAACWTPLTGYPDGVRISVIVGDLQTGTAVIAEQTPEPRLRQTTFSSLVPYFTPNAWGLVRRGLFVSANGRESLAIFGAPMSGIDLVVLARIESSRLQRQLTEYQLTAWATLISRHSTRIADAILLKTGAAFVRGEFVDPVDRASMAQAHTNGGRRDRTVERADLIILAQQAVLLHRGKTTPYTGSLNEKWIAQINEQALDLSKHVASQVDYGKKLAGLRDVTSERIHATWPDLVRDLSSLPDGTPLKISHSSDLLRVPFELIRDGNSYLALGRPTSRHLMESRPSQPLEVVLDALKHQPPEPFRAVLIGPHKGASLIRVQTELQMGRNHLLDWCRNNDVTADIRILENDKATCDELESTLRSLGRIHLLHFCGHGLHNAEYPERSSLAFLDKRGEYEYVNCRKLMHVFEEARIWFLYLSCCYSGAVSAPGYAGGSLSGVVHAGLDAHIPNILSYRWEVSDEGALAFAEHFYKRLFGDQPYSLSEVVHDCRRQMDGAESGFDAWASPILITTNH